MSELKKNITWAVVLVALIIAVLITHFAGVFIISRGQTEFQNRINKISLHLAEDHRKANLMGAITAFAGIDPDIKATAQGQLPPDNQAVRAKMTYLFDKLALDNMIVMAPDGEVKAYMVKNVTTSITGKNFAWRPYFYGAIAGNPTMYAAFGSNSLERGFYISVPIPTTNNAADNSEPAGVLVAKLGFEEIDKLVAQEKQPLMVLSPEEVVFASNRPDWLYKVLGGETELQRAKEEKRVNNAYKESPPLLIPLLDNGKIKANKQKLQMFSANIDWPDPSGSWHVAGFIGDQDIFCWQTRIISILVSFLLLLLLHSWVRSRQNVKQRTEQVISLLDNSGEGFLSFGSNMIVESEYSRACEQMLGASPAGQDIAELLFSDQPETVLLVHEIISSVMLAKEPVIQESMLSLLPRETTRGNRLLSVEYRKINSETFMVILNDITEQKRISKQLDLEQQRLKFIVMAVSDSRNFFEVVSSFREFIAQRQADTPIELRDLFREVHTFKGLLNQFSFPDTPHLLHQIETCLADLQAGAKTLIDAQKITGCMNINQLQSMFEADLAIINNELGEEFLNHGTTFILTDNQVRQLEVLSRNILNGAQVDLNATDVRCLLNEIIQLRKLCLAEVINSFEELVNQMAKRLEKQIAPLLIQGGKDIWLDPHTYKPFLQSLVHIFRNAVSHGIELPETRWENDKDEEGLISCKIDSDGNNIYMTIADDGTGLNLDALRAKALASGMTGKFEQDDEAAAELVFADSISTIDETTDLAGRGVGLAAVKAEIEKLGGTVKVSTKAGIGTEFTFVIPILAQGE